MALVVKDRVKETTSSTGTGTITLAGAVSGFQSFSVIGNGNTTYYTITDGTNWEVGIGTYTSSGTTLSRDTILESSNGGAAVNFGAGTKDVFVTYPAEKSISDGYGLLPVANGGTGATTAATARTNLGATTVGGNLFTLTNPSAITFPRFNADNTVSALDAATFRTAIGAGTSSTTGTVTSVALSGGTTGLTVSGSPITTSGTITLAGTLAVANGGTGQTSYTDGQLLIGNTATGGISKAALTAGSGISITNGNGSITIAATGGGGGMVYPGAGIAVSTGTAWGTSLTAPTGAIVGTTDTQTLTAKRINPRAVVASGTSGNLTINGDTTDLYEAEGLTGAITFLQPSGTPVDGQKLMVRIKDNGTARGITWTTSAGAFRAIGITLPTTTVLGKVTYVGCIYNSTDGFWDAVATVTQA